jgi:hypothetical protein
MWKTDFFLEIQGFFINIRFVDKKDFSTWAVEKFFCFSFPQQFSPHSTTVVDKITDRN